MRGYQVGGILASGETVNVGIPGFAEMSQSPGLLSFQYEYEGEKITRSFNLEHFAYIGIAENVELEGE